MTLLQSDRRILSAGWLVFVAVFAFFLTGPHFVHAAQFGLLGVGGSNAVGAPVPPSLLTSFSSGTSNSLYNNNSGAGIANPTLTIRPAWPFIGGPNNCAAAVIYYNNSYTPPTTLSDDKGDVFSAVNAIAPTGTGTSVTVAMKAYWVHGTTAGAKTISVALTGTPGAWSADFLGGWVQEFRNCASALGGQGTLATASTGAALTLTLSAAPASGDATVGYFLDIGTNSNYPMPFDASITPGTGFAAMSEQKSFGKLSEISTTSTSTSVQVTYPGTDNIIGVAFVLPKGLPGTNPPSTKYIDHYQVEQAQGSDTFVFPCSGSAVAASTTGGVNTVYVNGLTATSGTPQFPSTLLSHTNSTAQWVYVYGPTCSPSFSMTFTWSGAINVTSNAEEVDLVSVSNTLTTSAVLDAAHTTNGPSVATNVTTDSITPPTVGDLAMNVTSIGFHTETGTAVDANGHTPTFTEWNLSPDDDSQPPCTASTPNSSLAEDNGYGSMISTDLLAITFIYAGTQTSGLCTTSPTGVGAWDSASLALK